MIHRTEIVGSGIAAQACSALLRRFGWRVNRPEPGPTPVPYLVINSVTASLIKDVFEIDARSMGGYAISRRLVIKHWENCIFQVNEPALVVSAVSLNYFTEKDSSLCILGADDTWRMFAGERPPEGNLVTSGNRGGWIFCAASRGSFGSDLAVFEFIPEGWIFWAPLSARKGFLQFVLPQAQDSIMEACRLALEHTRMLKSSVELGECIAGPLPCSAAMHSQLIGHDWIATGSSALRYDPVSGDGTGASLRSAILACTTLRGVSDKGQLQQYLEHYSYRIRAAFGQHLLVCKSLYEQAKFSAGWNDDMSRLYILCRDNEWLRTNRYKFYLHDYRLVPTSVS